MRALGLCQACKRHIRVTESACPFCGAAFTAVAEPAGLRPRGRPGGRAALFLVGTAVVPGCADEPEPENQAVPAYGVAVAPDAAWPAPNGGAASDAGRDAGELIAVPVYGVAVYGVPPERDGGADANVCGDPQPPMAIPVYGVALDAALIGPDARKPNLDASLCGQDAGTPQDAGAPDARRPRPTRDAGTPDAEIMVVPIYGLWIEPQEDE